MASTQPISRPLGDRKALWLLEVGALRRHGSAVAFAEQHGLELGFGVALDDGSLEALADVHGAIRPV